MEKPEDSVITKDEELSTVENLKTEEVSKEEQLKSLKEWREKYKSKLAKTSVFVEISDEDHYKESFNKFKIYARQLIISSRLQETYILRQEEILASITDARKKLEEFESIDEHERVMKYSNGELQEMAMIRAQVLPNLLIELETISPAIRANNDNYAEACTECEILSNALVEYLS